MADQSPSSVLRQAAAKVRSGKSIVPPAIAEPLAAQWEELDRVWQKVGGTQGPARDAVRMAYEYADRAARLILEASDVG